MRCSQRRAAPVSSTTCPDRRPAGPRSPYAAREVPAIRTICSSTGLLMSRLPRGSRAKSSGALGPDSSGDGHPVGTGAYRLKEWTRGRKSSSRGEPGIPQGTLSDPGGGSEPGDAARSQKGWRASVCRSSRASKSASSRRRSRALLLFDTASSTTRNCPPASPASCSGNTSETAVCAARNYAVPPVRAGIQVHLLQHGRCGRRRLPRRRRSRCAARSRWATTAPASSRTLRSGQGVPGGAAACRRDSSGYDPDDPAADEYDPAAARALLDKFGYKGPRRRWRYREAPDGKPLTLALGVDDGDGGARERRAVEAQHGRYRHSDHVRQAELAELNRWPRPAS